MKRCCLKERYLVYSLFSRYLQMWKVNDEYSLICLRTVMFSTTLSWAYVWMRELSLLGLRIVISFESIMEIDYLMVYCSDDRFFSAFD